MVEQQTGQDIFLCGGQFWMCKNILLPSEPLSVGHHGLPPFGTLG